MPRLFLAAVIAGASYSIAAWAEWQGAAFVAWKGLGVALLALWLWQRTGGRDGRAMTAVLTFGALGDVLLATSMTLGAAAFLVGHLIATTVYWRRRRQAWFVAASGAALIAVIGYALTQSPAVTLYAAALGLMAGSAIASRLPPQIAIGAVLFVLSDLLIFARLGPLAESMLPTLLVWPLYFAGQALIAWGAARAFARERA